MKSWKLVLALVAGGLLRMPIASLNFSLTHEKARVWDSLH